MIASQRIEWTGYRSYGGGHYWIEDENGNEVASGLLPEDVLRRSLDAASSRNVFVKITFNIVTEVGLQNVSKWV